jgi:iron(III) transport system ATP-binding protein
MTIALTLETVRKLYGAKPAVDGVSLTLEAGRITCLLGPSGCGKSTLLRLIAGLEPLDGGTITSDRTLSGPRLHVATEQRDIGFVFQDYALFPHMTVEDNVGFGLKRLNPLERQKRALQQLDRVHLTDRAKAFPQALSGGEQQRIALARALAREPALVLLDEPFSGLDAHLKTGVRDATLTALRQAGTTALIVTHDAEEALMMADHLALMDQGQILQTGTPKDCYSNPVSLAAARLLGPTNSFPLFVKDCKAQTDLGIIDAPGLADGPAIAIIRPEALMIGVDNIGARVIERQFSGADSWITLQIDGPEGLVLKTKMPTLNAPALDTRLTIGLDQRACTVTRT